MDSFVYPQEPLQSGLDAKWVVHFYLLNFHESVNAPLTPGISLLILHRIKTEIVYSCFSFTLWCSFSYNHYVVYYNCWETLLIFFYQYYLCASIEPLYLYHFLCLYHCWSHNKSWYWLLWRLGYINCKNETIFKNIVF